MKRLLIVIDSLGYGGAERLLLTTLAHLDRSRFQPVVASLFGPNPLARPIRDLGVDVVELGLSGPRALPRAVAGLRGVMDAQSPDLIHTHLFASNVAGRVAVRGSIPVITTLHNPDYGQEGPGWGFGMRRLLDGSTAHLWTPTFLAVSDEVRRDYRAHLALCDVKVLHNYVDLDEFDRRLHRVPRTEVRRSLSVSADHFMLLHVGRFHRQKAQDVLIRAFSALAPSDPALQLTLAGEGPGRSDAERLAQRLGVRDRVRFLGAVEDPEALYSAADAFVFPSRYEAFGMALLESMAAGLPAVVSAVGGILELTTSATALQVPPDDARVLAGAIARLRGDARLASDMGQAARARATRFDATKAVARLECVYADA